MNSVTRKRQVRFWDYNINPITGWVERSREEMGRMSSKALKTKERAQVAFDKLNEAGI